jgi:hypothetical protein
MIEDNVYSYLAGQSTITDIVSTRIYPVILPQNATFPAVSFRAEEHDLNESFSGQNGLTESFYMLDAWGSTYEAARDLADAIRTTLKNHSGSFGGAIVQRVTLTSGPIPVYEDEVEAFRLTQIFSIWHKEE